MLMLRIGPAGLGPVKSAIKTLELYHKLGFRACEIAFTYGAYIKDESDARVIGKKAKELDISLSIHAPYFINLNSKERNKIEASKKKILECCRVGELLGAESVVFHAGYYNSDKEESYERIKEEIIGMINEIKKNRWRIKIAPEIMGKVNVFGSADEISALARETGCSFCIDFAHILAREKKVDYDKVKRDFPDKKWHCHFSGIVYGEKGERNHIPTKDNEWRELLSNLPKEKDITIINESPTMVEDCKSGLRILRELTYSHY